VTGHLIAAAALAAEVTPAEPVTSSITGILVGYGPLGVFVLVMGWLFLKRWRFISPDEEAKIRQEAREEGRADLTTELQRADARAERAETRAAQAEAKYDAVVEDLKPLLQSFVSVTSTLNPILQDIVRYGISPASTRRREE
jgi:hypothetical protein